MTNFIFLIGHPACGKTTLYKAIEQKIIADSGLTLCRISDRENFLKAAELDPDQRFHRKKPEGTLEITDPKYFELHFNLFREFLRSKRWQEDWIFVELTSSDYLTMLEIFGTDLFQNSYLILLLVSLQTSLKRNQKRPLFLSDVVDEYQVPEDYIIECHTQEFDVKKLAEFFKDSLIIDNNEDDLSFLNTQASIIFNDLLNKKESSC